MPVLDNPRHERFAQELVKGASQGQAYLNAGYKAKSLAVASAAATRLLKDVNIQRRLAELQQKTEVETMLTLDEHMRELKLLREMAKGKDDIKAAIAAEVKRGELRQFYVKRVETGGPGAFAELNDEELQQAILEQTRELAELDPEFAKQLALQKRATKH